MDSPISIVNLNDDPTSTSSGAASSKLNPLIARGAFGHVDIALGVRWARGKSNSSEAEAQSVSLLAIKTIPNATITSSSSATDAPAQLTREAFAELNALRVLHWHENVTPLLGFYGAPDSSAGGSGDGFGGWDWADDSAQQSASPTSLCLVFPYHPVDLAEALNYRRLQSFASGPPHNSFHLPVVAVQSIMHDILSALDHLHRHFILHRDVKPGNLYITMDGRIQLGDFGLAKAVPASVQPGGGASDSNTDCKNALQQNHLNVTTGLCTLQYRPPELLLGGTGIVESYVGAECANGALDIWSAGCIFAELLTLSGPLFPGQSVLDQLGRIFHTFGTPTEEKWPGLSALPDWNKVCFELTPGTGLQTKIFGGEERTRLGELVGKMLSLDPRARLSAQQCLEHSCIKPYSESCKCDQVGKRQAHKSVVAELVPPFLQVESPIYCSPPAEATINDKGSQCKRSTEKQRDPFAYAKRYASELVTTRRSFPQYFCNESRKEASPPNRWNCLQKSDGLVDRLQSIHNLKAK